MAAPTQSAPVSGGLALTLAMLTSTKNEAAIGALLPALDSPHTVIQDGALRAILDRRSPTGQREVLRRLHNHSQRLASDHRRAARPHVACACAMDC